MMGDFVSLADEMNVMTRDGMSAPRLVAGAVPVGALQNKPESQENPAQLELENRRSYVVAQLLGALAQAPVGSKERAVLEDHLARVTSQPASNLNTEVLNNAVSYAVASISDGDDAPVVNLSNPRSNRSRRHWDNYCQTDFRNNPHVYNGKVSDVNGFANHYGFDKEFLTITNEPFKDDPNVHNNPDILGLRGTLAKDNPAYHQNPGKTADAVAGNDHIASLGLMKYATREAIDKALETLDKTYGYDKKTGAKSISEEKRKEFRSLRQLIKEGYVSPETIALASDPNSYNNAETIQKIIEDGEKRRAEVVRKSEASIPEKVKEALLAKAQAAGIDIHRPLEEVMADARKVVFTPDQSGKEFKHQQPELRAELRAALKQVTKSIEDHRAKGIFSDTILLMDEKLTPAQRDKEYYSKSPQQRLEFLKNIYQDQYGQPMSKDVENQVKYQLEHVRTPAETRAFIEATRNAENKNPDALMEFYTRQTVTVLSEKAATGDKSAAENLSYFQLVQDGYSKIAASSSSLAKNVKGMLVEEGAEQISAKGQVDFGEMYRTLTESIAKSATAVGSSIVAGVTFALPTSLTTPEIQSASEKKAADNSSEKKPETIADQFTAALKQAADAGKGLLKSGTHDAQTAASEEQKAPAPVTQVASSRAAGQAAARA
jgi:hypothetical protein